MGGVLYNPDIEQKLDGIWIGDPIYKIDQINELLKDGWQVVSLTPIGDGDRSICICLLERRKLS